MKSEGRRRSTLLAAVLVASLCACISEPRVASDDHTVGNPSDPPFEPYDEPIELYIRVAERDLAHLYDRDVESDDRIPADLRVGDGEDSATRPASLRFRGNTSRRVAKKSFNVRTDEAVPVLGTDRLNLNAMWTDPAQMREHLAWWMFNHVGHPAPRSAYVNLHINDTYEGLYLFVERVDLDLLRSRGAVIGDASLVRDRSRFGDGTARSVFGLDPHATAGHSMTSVFDHRGEPDWDALTSLVSFVASTPPGDRFATGVAQHVQVDEFVDWLALNALIADVDSYGDDYWLYLDHEDPDRRWGVVPWDHDLSFGSHFLQGFSTRNDAFRYEFVPSYNPWENALVSGFYGTPHLRERIHERLEELMTGTFDEATLIHRIRDIAGAIGSTQPVPTDVEAFEIHPRQHFSDTADFDLHVEAVEDFVELRWAFLRNYLGGEGATTDTATVDLVGVGGGDRVLLTDEQGWTIAAFSPADATAGGTLTVEVEHHEGDGASVDRSWTLTYSDGELTGDLDLYYRNTTESDCGIRRCENWYVASDEVTFVGDQRHLEMVVISSQGRQRLGSTVNPYSNKVSARVDVPPSGTIEIRLSSDRS